MVTYGINLPTTPKTGAYNSQIANSELINPADFTVDPTVAGTGTVIGTDVSTFVNESVDGGTVTLYDSNGTPANLEMRWAKTDSVAAGGTDTWELFYQVELERRPARRSAWQNAGTDFTFNSFGPAESAR